MGSITMHYQRQNLALSVQSQGFFDLTWDDFYIVFTCLRSLKPALILTRIECYLYASDHINSYQLMTDSFIPWKDLTAGQSAVTQCSCQAEGVELIEEDYSLTEHRHLVQEDAFQCIVFADSGRSLKASQVGRPNVQIQGDI